MESKTLQERLDEREVLRTGRNCAVTPGDTLPNGACVVLTSGVEEGGVCQIILCSFEGGYVTWV